MTDQDTPTPTPKGQIEDALAAAASDDTFVCSKTWEAWDYDAMGRDSFTLLAEEPDMLSDMADDVILTLSHPSAIDRAAAGVAAYLRDLSPIHDQDPHDMARAAIHALLGTTP